MTANQVPLSIANEFSRTPGPRFRHEGKYSAEEFTDTVLRDKFRHAVETDSTLVVDLDGGYGYGTSFLEESFGGLAREFGIDIVLGHIDFKSEEEPYWKDAVFKYIREAKGRSR